jgi:hypothetical protein
MKRYKDFKTQILNEAGGMGGGFGGQVDDNRFGNFTSKADDGSVNLGDFEVPEVVDRLNAGMAFINQKPVVDPKARVMEIRQAFSFAGVDFDPQDVPIEVGTHVAPAKLWGGMIGMEDDGTFVNDSGFKRKTGQEWGIRFTWTKDKGMWGLETEIQPM